MKIIYIIILILFTIANNATATNISLTVKEQEGITRSNEMVHNGVPIAKAEALKSTSGLIITNNTGIQIPATFEVLSRWNGDPSDTDNDIQWLLVSFPASASANSTSTFYLRDGTPDSIANALSITNGASTITIDTGPSEFVISKTSLTLFDSISLNGTALLSGGGGATSTINGQSAASANAPTSVEIERSNGNYACIKVEGKYANTPIGTSDAEPLYYRIRYEFYAGSPTAIITHKFWWPGMDGGYSEKKTIDSVVNTLPTMTGLSSVEVYADASTYHTGVLSTGAAKVEQKRKTLFSDSSSAVVTHGSNTSSTTFATRPMLLAKNANGAIAVSMDHMHRFEPQSIEVTSSGNIKVAPMAEGQYFAFRQGTWARFSVSALPADATYTDALASTFAPLNSRLLAFPQTTYVNTTKVFGDIPTGAGSVETTFTNKILSNSEYTVSWWETYKWQGLMTWGSSGRNTDETGGSATGWDKVYSGAPLTDYHSTLFNIFLNFVYTGNPDWLYDVSFNAARRMLNTQIIQPNDTSSSSYMGWAPYGYGNYRLDQNSQHSYFENLYSYYYMTGDKEVTDILYHAIDTKRAWYTRDSGVIADYNTYLVDFVSYSSRADMQTASMFNFWGHTVDSEYLDDFEAMFHHLATQELMLLTDGSVEYAMPFGKQTIDNSMLASQCWMTALYIIPYMDILRRERGNIPLGADGITIDRFYRGYVNSLRTYNSTTSGGGGVWSGTWGNSLTVEYSGNKIGGTIGTVSTYMGSDPTVYGTGKGALAGAVMTIARRLEDESIISFGKAGVDYVETLSDFTGSKFFAKENGIFFTRLHGGIANYYSPATARRYPFRSISGD